MYCTNHPPKLIALILIAHMCLMYSWKFSRDKSFKVLMNFNLRILKNKTSKFGFNKCNNRWWKSLYFKNEFMKSWKELIIKNFSSTISSYTVHNLDVHEMTMTRNECNGEYHGYLVRLKWLYYLRIRPIMHLQPVT